MTKKSALEELAALLSEANKKKAPELQESNEAPEEDYIQALANRMTPQKVHEEIRDPLAPLNQKFVTFKDMNDHYTLFINRIQQQLASIGGGGEVKFLKLDDVDASTVGPNKHLAYNPTTGKVFFEEIATSDLTSDGYTTEVSNGEISVINLPANTDIGPVEAFSFNTSHEDDHTEEGTLCWNAPDGTLNLHHAGGVTQQIGQETYGYVRNGTANTIPNGTAVQFVGAEQNGTSRLLVGPMLADGTYPSLYVLGVATQDILPGEDGRVTVWGKVRDLDLSTFNVGDVLYVSTDTPGGFTNVKPTAPNNVIPIASVLNNDSENGEIFVRPTIEQQMSYGVFTRTTTLSPSNNVATVVGFDTEEIANGITLESGSQIMVSQSGLYQVEWTLHWDSQGTGFGTDPVYTFLRKNGQDIPNTLRRNSVSDFDPAGQTFTSTRALSLDANDYIEVVIVTTGGNVDLTAISNITSPFNAPATAAAEITVAQIQL